MPINRDYRDRKSMDHNAQANREWLAYHSDTPRDCENAINALARHGIDVDGYPFDYPGPRKV